MKAPKLPKNVHARLEIYGEYALYDHDDVKINVFVIPSKWVKFNGQEQYNRWSWNEKYLTEIHERFGNINCRINIIEFNLMQNMAFIMKSSKEIGFDVMDYYTQFKDEDIKYHNSVGISVYD